MLHVRPGERVDEIAAELLPQASGRPLVALGGGRVIDTAKAIAGASGERCAALPTTLSGAPMTLFHRLPADVEGARFLRPAPVGGGAGADDVANGSAAAASAMNALAHAVESLYTPLANPVASLAAVRAAELFARTVPEDDPDRDDRAGRPAGGYGWDHGPWRCTTRSARRSCASGAPHAETNAVMLPHSARLMVSRAPGEIGALAEALGDVTGDPAAAPGRLAKLAACSGHTRLDARCRRRPAESGGGSPAAPGARGHAGLAGRGGGASAPPRRSLICKPHCRWT